MTLPGTEFDCKPSDTTSLLAAADPVLELRSPVHFAPIEQHPSDPLSGIIEQIASVLQQPAEKPIVEQSAYPVGHGLSFAAAMLRSPKILWAASRAGENAKWLLQELDASGSAVRIADEDEVNLEDFAGTLRVEVGGTK